MSAQRLQRVESLLKEELGALILRREIKDPRVNEMVVVNAVEVSKDLAHAKVWVAGYLTARKLTRAVEGLNHAAGFIQARLGRKLKFRTTPRLRFVEDHSLEEGYRVTQALKDISP